MGKWLIAVGMALALAGCASPARHPPPPTAASDWPALPASAVREVRQDRIQAAVALLAERESLALDAAQIGELAEPASCSQPDELDAAYLVRGVAYGVATFTVVRQDPASGSVAVWQGTYNGGNAVYGAMMRDRLPAPVIVRLPRAPTRVFTSAEVGGDALAARAGRGAEIACAANEDSR